MARGYHPRMPAPRALTLVFAATLAGCANPTAVAPSLPPVATAEPTPAIASPAATASQSSRPAASPRTSPAIAVDPAAGLEIAPPYELDVPTSEQLAQLSGNIQGLATDLAESAGAEHAPSDFPMGARFVREGERSVGLIVVLDMPPGVAGKAGLLEPIAAAVAAEVNALLSYETIQGVKVGLVRGPIASAVAIVDGRFVMAQSGQPAVDPRDLMTAVIAAQ